MGSTLFQPNCMAAVTGPAYLSVVSALQRTCLCMSSAYSFHELVVLAHSRASEGPTPEAFWLRKRGDTREGSRERKTPGVRLRAVADEVSNAVPSEFFSLYRTWRHAKNIQGEDARAVIELGLWFSRTPFSRQGIEEATGCDIDETVIASLEQSHLLLSTLLYSRSLLD